MEKFNFYNRKLRILNFCHTDLDGAVSAIVIRNVFEKVITVPISYRSEINIGGKLDRNINDVDAIIFTDFCPTISLETVKSYGKPVLVLDHHESARKYNDPANQIYVNEIYCGAKLAYKFFEKFVNLKHLETLVELTDDYDRWILKDNRSFPLNQLFWANESIVDFIDRFNDGNINLSDAEKKFLIETKKKISAFIDKLEIMELPNDGVLSTCSEYLGEVSYELQKKRYKWICMFNPKTENLSMRSRDNNLNLIDVTKMLGIGGGHSKAVGIPCAAKDLKTVIAKSIKIVSDIFAK